MICWDWLFFSSSDWCISILAVHSVICSLGGPLSHGSPVVVFFDRGHPRFWNFYSTFPVDVVRVKSYMNCLFDPACIVIRVTINKLYFVPEWLVSGVVGMFWNGGGLGTGESNVSIVHEQNTNNNTNKHRQTPEKNTRKTYLFILLFCFSTSLPSNEKLKAQL